MSKDMTSGNPGKLILMFTLPMLIGNIFQQVYNMVDTVIVGRFVNSETVTGTQAIAAVGTSFPLMFLVISVVSGLAMGSSILISQLFGANKQKEIPRAVGTTLSFMLIMAIVMSLIGFFTTRPVLVLLNAEGVILEEAVKYLQIIYLGTVFTMAYNVFASILRGIGDSKTPLYFLIIASILNVLLDLLFVVVFGWGVSGAAIATVISQAVSSILCGIYMYVKIPILRLKKEDFKFDKHYLSLTLKYGLPSAIQQLVVSLGLTIMQGLINSFKDSYLIAGITAATKIDAIAMAPIVNFGMSISTFTAQNIGAKRIDRVKKSVWHSFIILFSLCVVLGVVIVLFGPYLIKLFINTKEIGADKVINFGDQYIKFIGCFYFMFAFLFIFNSVLRGAGDSIIPMVSSLVSLGVRVVSAYMLALVPFIGYKAIWWSVPIGWFVAMVIPIPRYISGKWKHKASRAIDRKSEVEIINSLDIIKE